MKSNRERIEALEHVAETSSILTSLGAVVLADITAARGEPEQQRHTRPRLHDDIRDPDAQPPAEPRPPEPRTIDYSDPTGTRAVKDDPASRDLAEIDKRLKRAKTDMAVVARIFQRHQAARTPDQIKDVRKLAGDELNRNNDDWCKSHLRVGVLEPITLRKGSEAPYYSDQCKECGDLAGDLRRNHPRRFRNYHMPPVELVTIRTYRRLRQSDIDALLGPQHHPKAKRKQRPGEDRQRRSA